MCRPRDHAKGNYFTLTGRSPFSRLIYPVPVPGGLGVHLTIDLGGQARFGPDVEWIDEIEYTVDPSRCDSFYDAVRKYWPDLKDGALQPGYAGIRPKTVPKGAPGQDFVVQGPQTHGVAGLISLFGIESPGLTASLAIADHVVEVSRTGVIPSHDVSQRGRVSAYSRMSGDRNHARGTATAPRNVCPETDLAVWLPVRTFGLCPPAPPSHERP